jgi:molybdenum-dependent DNA-binding transcriptional regulator ModE
MLKILTAVDRASITQTAKALKISADRASELMCALQKYGLVRVENQRTGGRGRPRKVATLSDSGRLILKILQGKLDGCLAIRERELRLLLQQSREWCKRCSSTELLGPACLAVASYAHLLGMDWECGVPIFSCQRWPKQAKSWVELVEEREVS